MSEGRDKYRLRERSSWWIDHPDGTVTLVILRRIEGAMGSWAEHKFTASTEAECLARYDEYSKDCYERAVRRAGARANYGIKSYLP